MRESLTTLCVVTFCSRLFFRVCAIISNHMQNVVTLNFKIGWKNKARKNKKKKIIVYSTFHVAAYFYLKQQSIYCCSDTWLAVATSAFNYYSLSLALSGFSFDVSLFNAFLLQLQCEFGRVFFQGSATYAEMQQQNIVHFSSGSHSLALRIAVACVLTMNTELTMSRRVCIKIPTYVVLSHINYVRPTKLKSRKDREYAKNKPVFQPI